jgi:hypothetical protein
MAYPQADISTDHVYMEIPKWFEFEGSRDTCCQKTSMAARLWEEHRTSTWKKGLKELGFEQSMANECVFYRSMSEILIYLNT